jgi:hypothetical protein
MSIGGLVQAVTGHRELAFDKAANLRQGECLARIENRDLPVRFVVRWRNREKGEFAVELVK